MPIPDRWAAHFAKPNGSWEPYRSRSALASRMLVVAAARVEGAWVAHVEAVPGFDHSRELEHVLDHGTKLPESVALLLFPEAVGVPNVQ